MYARGAGAGQPARNSTQAAEQAMMQRGGRGGRPDRGAGVVALGQPARAGVNYRDLSAWRGRDVRYVEVLDRTSLIQARLSDIIADRFLNSAAAALLAYAGFEEVYVISDTIPQFESDLRALLQLGVSLPIALEVLTNGSYTQRLGRVTRSPQRMHMAPTVGRTARVEPPSHRGQLRGPMMHMAPASTFDGGRQGPSSTSGGHVIPGSRRR